MLATGVEVAGKHRNHTASSITHRLSIGVVTVGLGVAVSTGQGIAFGDPADGTAGGTSTNSSTDGTGGAQKPAVKAGSRSSERAAASTKSSGDAARHADPTSTVTHREKIKKRAASNADASSGTDKPAVPSGDAAAPDEATLDAAVAVDAGGSDDAGTPTVSHRTSTLDTEETPAAADVTAPSGQSHASAAPEALSAPVAAEPTAAAAPARTASVVHTIVAKTPEVTTPVASTSSAQLVSVSAPQAAAAAPVTLASIVTDVLSWVGLGSLATHLPVPALPVGHLVEALWLAVREVHDRLTGVGSGASSVVAAAPALDSAPLSLAELLARDGVTVSTGANGAVDYIDGAFTDTTVTSAADAAGVLNGLASVLGASAGFATADNITVQRIGSTAPGDIAETFYRVRDNVNGVPVLGSDVELVTDADGRVTGLFNNHDARVDGMDLTADRRVDTRIEAVTLAATAYLKSVGRPTDWLSTLAFVVFSKFDPQLVVAAGDETAAPQLTWRVVINPPQPLLAPPTPAALYYINANGADATKVMLSTSAAQALTAATATAKDVLGQTRTIDVAKVNLIFFQSYRMQDLTRNLTTYKTKYGFLGLGPIVPSSPLSKGWFGWNVEAVSAQANVAAVYDYYQSVLNLTSINGSGAPVKIVVNYNPVASWAANYDNAYWDANTQQLVFGDGADLEGALDIVAHEYTHAVISYIVGTGGSVLDYGESGALNEAYADIMGNLIEGKTDAGAWQIGEDSTFTGGMVRNIADPASVNTAYGVYRVTYADRYTGTGDDAGEHVNSTIFSHAVYKMMTDPATAGISSETWAKVFYHSMYRLSTSAKFTDGRAAVVDTAAEFGFTAAQLAAINQAFDNAGIVAPVTTIAV